VRLAPSHQPFTERTRSGQHLVEPPLGGSQVVLGDPARTDAVAPLDLVGIGDPLAGKAARRHRQADDLGAEPPPASDVVGCRDRTGVDSTGVGTGETVGTPASVRRQVQRRRAVEVVEQGSGLGDERAERPR
jgi:hypothetical protein